jgi:hypothetical protein
MSRSLRSGPGRWTPARIRSSEDALVLKVSGLRDGDVHALVATAANAEAYREVRGLLVTSAQALLLGLADFGTLIWPFPEHCQLRHLAPAQPGPALR